MLHISLQYGIRVGWGGGGDGSENNTIPPLPPPFSLAFSKLLVMHCNLCCFMFDKMRVMVVLNSCLVYPQNPK